MATKTQGTSLYFIRSGQVITVGCATQVGNSGGTVSAVVGNCLDTNLPTVDPGTRSETQLTFDINFEPTNEGHVDLYEMFRSDPTEETYFAYGYSDGTAPPTVGTEGFDFPNSRSFKSFYGFVSDYSETLAGNALVSASLVVTTADAVLIPAAS